ncbi:hypothetical protein SLA2020_463410 [Shorea laevis]
MNWQSLLAAAAINIGLALIVLSLFSIFKKQPSNASIYYARRLAKRHPLLFHHSLTLSRFLPSVSWIPRAFRVTEDEILQTSGLDALVVIRLFKFGMKFFSVCSLVGLVVLLPINYNGRGGESTSHHCMDAYTISNIERGSNWLWVHFVCLWFISLYALYLLYKEYDKILVKRIQQLQNLRHHPDQFTTLVRQIPFCFEHKARGCSVGHFFSKHYSHSYHSHQMLYDGKHIGDLVNQAKYIEKKIEDLREKCAVKQQCQDDFLKLALLDKKRHELHHEIRQLQSEDMLKVKELPVAFVKFRSRRAASLAAQSQQHSNPLLWITEMAPEPKDVSWRNLAIPYKFLFLHKIGVIVAASLLTIFFAIPVTAVQGIAKFEKLKKWFPPAMAIQLIPGLSSVVTGFLPSAILKGFLYVVPFAMLAMAKAGGSVSNSRAEIKACNMVFYFLMGNVFFLSMISGSLLDEIGESFTHPKDFPSHLADAVSAQADFFMTYILADGFSGFSFEILQPGLLLWDFLKMHTYGRGKEKNPYLFSLPYFRIIPMVSLSILIGMVYAVIAPLLLPFLVGYFLLGYAVYINQIQDVYDTVYDTFGKYWPFIHHYVFVAIVLMQITMIGVFVLKKKPASSISTIPLLLVTIMFNEYCKMRFLPTFQQFSIQNAVENDELDDVNGEKEANCEDAFYAYRHPSLQPVSFTGAEPESSFTEPLISAL